MASHPPEPIPQKLERTRSAWLTAALEALRLESAGLTAAYWGTVGLFALSWWVTAFPPAIDYPQHLLLGVLLRRIFDPSSLEHQTYVFQPITYNGLFQILVALGSLLLQAEAVGKLVLSSIPVLIGLAGLAVMRWAGRPRWYAFPVLPLAYSYTLGWGFINYSLTAPITVLLLVGWLKWRDTGSRKLLPFLALGGLVVAYSHVLATLCLMLSIGVLTVGARLPREIGIRRWLVDLVRLPLPFAPACIYSVLVYLVHRVAPHIYWEPEKEGADVPGWTKIRNLSSIAVENLSGDLDERLFWLGLLGILALFAIAACIHLQRVTPGRREMRILAVTWFLAYLLMPRIAMSTWWIFERLPFFWILFLAASAPTVALPEIMGGLRVFLAGVALASGVNTVHAFATIPDTQDASAILDDIPAHSRVVALMFSPKGEPAVSRELWIHLLAYYEVRRPGEIAFDFTRYASLPVRRADAGKPPLFPSGLEWMPESFDPHAAYASYFTHLLVRTPDEAPDQDPRARIFKDRIDQVKVASHRGRFWLLDASEWQTHATEDY